MIILDTVKGAGIASIEKIENNHCIAFDRKMYDEAMNCLI